MVRRGDVRRAKLYYLRDLRGKAAKIKEKRGIGGSFIVEDVIEAPVVEAVVETPVVETPVEAVVEAPVVEAVVETPAVEEAPVADVVAEATPEATPEA
jgi:hypothetical protein